MKDKVTCFAFSFLLFGCLICPAQEFFPNLESASNLPKGVLAASLSNEAYMDVNQLRLWQGYTLAYGINSKLSISQTYSFSNHHGYFLPDDFITTGPSDMLSTQGYKKGQPYPFSFENFEVELKWRFLNIDGEKKHFRMAAYMQLAGGNEPHITAEPDLAGDNSGAATGIIATWLKNKFAISGSAGYIIPNHYYGSADSITIRYGDALNYNLAFGYVLLPSRYKDYKQTGLTIYVELIGESYDVASVLKNGEVVSTGNAPSLAKCGYLEARPALQLTVLSNTRIDFSAGWLIAGASYERSYPVFYFSILHNFYL